jgi:hypothetical protein
MERASGAVRQARPQRAGRTPSPLETTTRTSGFLAACARQSGHFERPDDPQ